jgi:hypothetical protein
MLEHQQTIAKLADLLNQSSAKAVIAPERLTSSTIYDLQYRIAICALLFQRLAKPGGADGRHRVSSGKLKFFQFVALRPWLLGDVEEWSKESRQGSLELTHSVRIRRGFLTDSAYDDVINFLTCCDILKREGQFLTTGSQWAKLTELSATIEQNDFFNREQSAISALMDIKITNYMLEGW